LVLDHKELPRSPPGNPTRESGDGLDVNQRKIPPATVRTEPDVRHSRIRLPPWSWTAKRWIIFWIVTDAKRAALEVASYGEAIAWAAQTSLRETIGAADLAMLLSNRRAADEELRKTIDAKTADFGIRVRSVEIRDVQIPVALQDAMSRQAQAERERQARVILSTAEAEIADKFAEAARTYANNPIALHLRGMNMLYESVKERGGTTIIVPSSAVDSMNLGGVAASPRWPRQGQHTRQMSTRGRPARQQHRIGNEIVLGARVTRCGCPPPWPPGSISGSRCG
jgi:hypothetical protein